MRKRIVLFVIAKLPRLVRSPNVFEEEIVENGRASVANLAAVRLHGRPSRTIERLRNSP
jgi:hypothetical protein